ncbi:ATP-binding protein [Allofournierella massiliensis]|uniref:ATP-binding protein n=1 Tax=Allofournierella massiliensis TaxID=1650663 RepID=UPI0035681D1E
MLNQATMDMLTAMKMTAMAAEFANQLKDPTFNELGFEERLGLLVNAEWNRRQSNKLNRFIRNARFAVPSATVEGIEYHEDRKLDKAQMLRFATCQYIDEGHHIILKGASGNGKTYIACALGNAACRRFKKVQYIRMPELLDELSIARSGGTLKKVLESYKKKDLLILDEWLIRPLSPQESYDTTLRLFGRTIISKQTTQPKTTTMHGKPFRRLSTHSIMLPFPSSRRFTLPLRLMPYWPLDNAFGLPSASKYISVSAVPSL